MGKRNIGSARRVDAWICRFFRLMEGKASVLPLFRVLLIVNGYLLISILSGCREDELVVPTEYELIPEEINMEVDPLGMYLLNEGNMGSNKSSLDFLDYRNAFYVRNLYAERNPTVIKELGDVGNDIQIYGSKLYAVINSSHKVEVMEAISGRRIAQVDIPNCRYIRFYKGKAYVSSYVGPVQIDPNAQKGAIYKVDTTSLKVLDKVTVGYQPEEMEIIDDYMYVANSGGYRKPNYDNTVSVIDMEMFKQVEQIPVAINLHRVKKDAQGQLWVSSRGDNGTVNSNLYVLKKKQGYNKMVVSDTLNIPCSNMAIHGDSLYLYSTQYIKSEDRNRITYGIISIRTHELVSEHFITDGTESNIEIPYGIAVHPVTGDIYVTDAKNYVSSGQLHCYNRKGKLKWSVRTGDIPASMTFLWRRSNKK